MNVPNIPSSLFTEFNDVIYYDEPHKYYVGDNQLTSVTTLIHKFFPEFDTDYWAVKSGNKWGQDPEKVKYAWKFINEQSTEKGSILHDYAENRFLNKVFPYPKERVVNHFGYDPVIDDFKIARERFDKFWNQSKKALVTIRTEMVVWDKEFDIGGMVDALFYNKKSGEFEIWDHKTNKAFNYRSEHENFGVAPISHLEDCEFNQYSLQLSFYKYIIEKYCNIKLGDSYLIWYGNKESDLEIIKTKNLEEEVRKILRYHKLNISF